MDGEAVEKLELSEHVFGVTPNVAVLHQVVTAQLVNRRQGTASTKTRSEVRGGGRKPYRQKGTGRARQGSIRAPQFRGGGTVFGPKPRRYHHDVPKKMRRLAIRSALSDKVANENLIVVKDLVLEAPHTKDMLAILDKLPITGKRVLMMLPRRDENIMLSARNIPTAKVQHVSSINVVELLKHDCVIMPIKTVRWIELVFGEGMSADEATAKVAEEFPEEEQVITDEDIEESIEGDEEEEEGRDKSGAAINRAPTTSDESEVDEASVDEEAEGVESDAANEDEDEGDEV